MLRVEGEKLHLALVSDWLENNPLTQADLDNEIKYLGQIGYTLAVETLATE